MLIYNILYRIRPARLAVLLKSLLGVKRRLVETKRGRFWLDPVSNLGNPLMNGRDYESELAEYISEVLQIGDCFLDVGANEGYFSAIASQAVGTHGRVVSIEPQSRLHEIISRNIGANSDVSFKILPLAVSDANGEAKIRLTHSINTGSSGLGENVKATATETVEMVTLDCLLERVDSDQIHLMKMDIESFEYEAIVGSPSTLTSHRIRRMAIEFHKSMLQSRGKDPKVITDALQDAGYQVRLLAGYLIAELPKMESERIA